MWDVRRLREAALAVDDRLRSLLRTLAGLVLLGMMLLMVYNVVARTWFDAPVDGIVSIVGEALMVAMVYLALSTPIHISIRIVVQYLPATLARYIDLLTWAVSVAVLAIAGWASWGRAVISYQLSERTVGTFTFELYPYKFLVAVGLFATAVHVLLIGRRWVAGVREEERSVHGEPSAGHARAAGAEPRDLVGGPAA